MKTPGLGRPRVVGRQNSRLWGGNCKTSAFTLVEMLVVIAIIVSVAVVALPAITSLSKSSSRRTAVSLTMAALDQARTLALGHSTPHYLVFADADPTWPETHRQRAFAVFEETYDPQNEVYRRQPVSAWTQLPSGIAFKADADTIFAAPREKFYCHPAGRELALPCFKFTDIGGLELPTKVEFARLRLFEGFIDAGGTAVTTNKAGAAAEEVIKVSLQTGRAQREGTNATN
jgi:prepilin-type N-terminal cleavage/methylation domain-containing protein